MGQANAAKNLAVCSLRLNRQRQAEKWRLRSMELFERGRDVIGQVELLNRFAFELYQSNHPNARALYENARELLTGLGDEPGSPFELGKALAGLAHCAHRDGNRDRAIDQAREAEIEYDKVGAVDEIDELHQLLQVQA
jgi:hypothetical protein